jgi:hypothetical protein
MAYRTFFNLSAGLSRPIQAPIGTRREIIAHVNFVERTLGFKRRKYKDNPWHWQSTLPVEDVSDKIFCELAEEHNRFVRKLYEQLMEWSECPPEDGETITPKDAEEFWHGLVTIPVPTSRWTPEYYIARMEAVYEVLRGRECEGMTPEGKALNPRQAAFVIRLFSEFLDVWDRRLDVPLDCDHLASSYDGGYEWCEKCGPVTEDHLYRCRKKKCPMREESNN